MALVSRDSFPDPVVIGRPAAAQGRWRLVVPLPIYAVLAVLLFHEAWQSPQTTVIGYGQDPPFFIWSFSWFPFALSHGIQPLISGYLDYPSGINLMGSTSAPLLGLLLWPVTATWGPVVAYNLSITAGVALSAWCAYLLCLRVVQGVAAAAIAGLIYGFSPFMIGHSLGHPHLVVAVFPPLLGLLAYDMLARDSPPRLYHGVLLGLVLSAQFFISEELLAMDMVAAVLGLVVGASVFPGRWRDRVKACARPVAIGLAICATLAALPVAIQFFGTQHVADKTNPGGFYVSDLLGFIVPTPLQWLSPGAAIAISQRFTGNLAESVSYVGVPLLLIAAYAAVSAWGRPIVRLVAIFAFLLGVLSLGPTLHVGGFITPLPGALLGLVLLPWRRHFPVGPILVALTCTWVALAVAPVISNILPSRLMLLVFLLLAILVAVFLRALLELSAGTRIVAVVAVATVFLTFAPVTGIPSTAYPIPGLFHGTTSNGIREGSVVLVAPYAYEWDDLSMVWQATGGMSFKMPEGYGTVPGPALSPSPTDLGDRMIAIDRGASYEGISQQTRERLLAQLKGWRVEAVVVGPMNNQAAMVRFLSDLIGDPPEDAGGVFLWRAVAPAL